MRYRNDGPHEIVIVGTGFSGIAAAIRLLAAGERDVLLLERADDVGGTWRDNRYPGCACDVPSHLYSLSFAPNPEWSRSYSPQAEIHGYLRALAEEHGLLPRIRFGTELREASWDDDAQLWTLQTSTGTIATRTLITAVGGLSEPATPKIAGLDRFGGTTFHSARWNHDHDLRGRRVAVIGTGASAIQFVPEIQPDVEHLDVFQRTPPWIVPRRDRALKPWEHQLFRRLPLAQRAARAAIYWVRELTLFGFIDPSKSDRTKKFATDLLERQVEDPGLRAKLTPDYTIGCKRILISNRWYPALTEPNVDVVSDSIREVTETGVVTADGREHPCDTIIFGTGFEVTDPPIVHKVRGRGGRTLAEAFDGSPRAHLGLTINGFPNLFFLLGPNTGLGHTSITVMIEAQVDHLLEVRRHMRTTGAATVEPTPEAQAAFVAEVDRYAQGTVWATGGCSSWYQDRTGRISTLWPTFTFRYRRRVQKLRAADYRWLAPRSVPTAVADGTPEPAGVVA